MPIEGNRLIVEIERNHEPEASASGKMLLTGSCHGKELAQPKVNRKNVVVGLNASIPIK